MLCLCVCVGGWVAVYSRCQQRQDKVRVCSWLGDRWIGSFLSRNRRGGDEQKRKDRRCCALINPQQTHCYNIIVVKHCSHNSASGADGILL